MPLRTLLVPALILLAACVLPACSSVQSREIAVDLDDSLARTSLHPTVQVDVVGLTDSERKQWDDMSLSSYWMPGSERRASATARTIRIRFGAENTDPVRIPADADVWDAWRKHGATWLYVVANLPGGMNDKPGAEDPRRLAISLTSKEWADDAPLEIEVRRDAVVFVAPRRGDGVDQKN